MEQLVSTVLSLLTQAKGPKIKSGGQDEEQQSHQHSSTGIVNGQNVLNIQDILAMGAGAGCIDWLESLNTERQEIET